MKKVVLLVFVFWSLISGLMAQELMTLTRFEGKGITGIDVSGAWDIQISQGASTKAVVTFPARFESQLVFKLGDDGQLELGFQGDFRTKQNEKFTAVIVCSSLHEIDLSGACKLNGSGKFTGKEIKFELSGATQVTMEGELVPVNGFSVDMSGASKMSGKIMSPKADIDLSGASQLSLSGTSGTGKVELSGASKAELGELTMRRINVDVSGASKLNLNVSELIEGEISGGSRLVYRGEGTIRVDVSGAATLKRH